MKEAGQEDGVTKVTLCGCGKLHFSYGPVTVHFERDQFLQFAESVGRIAACVRQAPHNQATSGSAQPASTLCH
ncbi:MAG: hypothetical protein U0172_12705 [Nitrospiraceae bacterium]